MGWILCFNFMSLAFGLVLSLHISTRQSSNTGNLRARHISSNITYPSFHVRTHDAGYEDDLYTFLAPYGFKISHPGPTIVDNNGTLIWTASGYDGDVMNFKAQQYKGKPCLTFWTGNNRIQGHGTGYYHILDSSYNEIKTLGAKNDLGADLHEFTITNDDTALVTAYQAINADFTQVHNRWKSGYIWDCIFQEIDLETDKLIFEWRASEHMPLKSSYRKVSEGLLARPWDWCHINSVEKDEVGNYLVSLRDLCSIAYISPSGEVLWQVGGMYNNFTDLSNGNATDFAFQHHARWTPDKKGVTLFDNAVSYDDPTSALYSRGMHLALDTKAMTVKLVKEYSNPVNLRSLTQGSMQILPNNNVLLGFGDVPAYTELSHRGEVIRTSSFGQVNELGNENAQSYGVYKYPWKGFPDTDPDIGVRGRMAYVSWNGATEVKTWCLQHGRRLKPAKKNYDQLHCTAKAGFETEISFEGMPVEKYIRVTAVDKNGEVLGTTRGVDWKHEGRLFVRVMDYVHQYRPPSFLYRIETAFVAASSLSILMIIMCHRRAPRWLRIRPSRWSKPAKTKA